MVSSCTHIRTHVCKVIRWDALLCWYMHTYAYVRTYIHINNTNFFYITYACLYLCTFSYIYTCICVFTYLCIHA